VVSERGRATARLTWVRGEIVDVTAAFTGEFFGTFLLERGRLTMAQLQQSLQRMYGGQRLQGEVLVELGLIPEADLAGLLTAHASERIVEVIGWEGADFRFLEGETSVVRPLAIATAPVLFRGYLERSPMTTVEAELAGVAAAELRPRVARADLDAAHAGEAEAALWERIHAGHAGVAELLAGAASDRTRRFLFALLMLGYAEPQVPAPSPVAGEAGAAAPPRAAPAAVDPHTVASAAPAAAPAPAARAAAVATPAAGPSARPGLLVAGFKVADEGRLDATPAVAVLRAFLSSPRSGRLVFARGRAQKTVDLGGRGVIGTVWSIAADAPFGNYLLERGLIGFDVYERTLQRMYAEKRRHGELLVEEGALSADDLKRHLREHFEHRLVDLFGWTDGTYRFDEAPIRVTETHVDVPRVLFLGARSSLSEGMVAAEIARLGASTVTAAPGVDPAALDLAPADLELWRSLRQSERSVSELLDEAGETMAERARWIVAMGFARFLVFRGSAPATAAVLGQTTEPRRSAPGAPPPPPRPQAPTRPAAGPAAPARPAGPAPATASKAGAEEPSTDELLLNRESRNYMRTIHIKVSGRGSGGTDTVQPGQPRMRRPRLTGFGETAEFEDKIAGGAWEGDVDVEFVRDNLSKTLKWMSHQHRFKILDAHESLTTEELEERYQKRRSSFDPEGHRYGTMPPDIRTLASEICKVIDEAWQFLRDEPRRIEYRRNLFGESNLALEADVQFKKGDVMLFWKRDPEGAIPLYISSIDLYPKNPDYHAALGLAIYRANRKRLAEALSHIERGVKLRGESELPFMYLGMIYRDEGARGKAAEAFKRAIQVNPRSKDARTLLERLNRGLGDETDDELAE